jgi:hypothetical protein
MLVAAPNEAVELIVLGMIFPPAGSCNFAADLLPASPLRPSLCGAGVEGRPQGNGAVGQLDETRGICLYYRIGGISKEGGRG